MKCCSATVNTSSQKLQWLNWYKRNSKSLIESKPLLFSHENLKDKSLTMFGEMYGNLMYSTTDKMMMNGSKQLGPSSIAAANCFSGRYSPTYRVPDQMRDPMRRCMTNPPVRTKYLKWEFKFYYISNVLILYVFLAILSGFDGWISY